MECLKNDWAYLNKLQKIEFYQNLEHLSKGFFKAF